MVVIVSLQNKIIPKYFSKFFFRYNACLSIQSYCATSHSEDNLDEDVAGPSRRKTKKKHIRRRSGSIYYDFYL